MLNSRYIMEESGDTDAMTQHESDLEMEEKCVYQRKRPEERRSYHDVGSSERCCEQLWGVDPHELDRISRRRAKSQARRHMTCMQPHETWKYTTERVNNPQDVATALNTYQNLLNKTAKKSQDFCAHTPYLKRRQTRTCRRPRKVEQDPTMFAMRNTIDSDANPRVYCEYEQMVKRVHNREIQEEQSDVDVRHYEAMKMLFKDMNIRENIRENMQMRERMSRRETGMLRQHPDKINKSESNGNKQFSDDEHSDLCRGRLRFNLPDYENSKDTDLINIEEDRRNQTRRKPNPISNKPFAIKSNLRTGGLQNLSKYNNIDDLTEQKNQLPDRSPEEDARKEIEDRTASKQRKQPVRQTCKPNEEIISGNRKETKEETQYDMLVKDVEEDENLFKKNIYGGGDLELRATKSQILSLIDRAISNEFSKLSDQQQGPDSNRESAGQEICIEIMRVLQGDFNCCRSLAEDLLSHHESSAECIKLLKMLRWDQMNHIQEEFRKLCNLQKFLDTYSPRQSSTAFHPVAVEQQRSDTNERQQQQHEEKQNSGTVP